MVAHEAAFVPTALIGRLPDTCRTADGESKLCRKPMNRLMLQAENKSDFDRLPDVGGFI